MKRLESTVALVAICLISSIVQPTRLTASAVVDGYTFGDRGASLQPIIVPDGKNTFVVVILMENRDYRDIIGNLSAAPYLNSLANSFGLATNYYQISLNRSLPNYFGLIAGAPYTPWSACNDPPSSCNGFTPIRNATLIDRMESMGLTWRAYMEDMPSNCYAYNFANYVPRHDPFVYLARIINSTSECAKVEPAGPQVYRLVAGLNSHTNASNLMWLTPNLCNDMHDCTTLAGDTFLSNLIPQILNSYIFQTQNAALFVTWDEGRFTTHIPAIWVGPAIRNLYKSNMTMNHYSFLKTLEALWDLSPLTNNDMAALPMSSFFGARNQLNVDTVAPVAEENVSFTGKVVQGVSPFQYSWSFGDGGTSNVSSPFHSFRDPGTYNVTLSTTDNLNHTAVSMLELAVAHELGPSSSAASPVLPVIALTATAGLATFTVSYVVVRRNRRKQMIVAEIFSS